MKAAVRTRYGPPEVVRVTDIATPTPGDREVLVKVHLATVNRTDCGFRAAKPFFIRFFSGLTKPRARVLGGEFAGVVEAVGSGATSFAVGDRVFGFSEDRFGAHAEYLAIPEDAAVASIPPSVGDEQAASSTEASHYALTNIRAAKIRAGQDVLVYGATGAIGTAAVQLLKHLGASVTAVCSSEHVELVRGLGADRVIDRTAQDFTRDDHIYDVVFDAVGKSSFGRCRRLLKPRGIYLSTDLGPLAQNPLLALLTPLLRGRKLMFPIPRKRDRQTIEYLKELLASGALKPVVDRRYRLDEIVEAYRYVETGQKIGNVLIDVAPSTP
jgi:NADPH:quinone reductase-like Zn-dependent oxidoreductase